MNTKIIAAATEFSILLEMSKGENIIGHEIPVCISCYSVLKEIIISSKCDILRIE